MEHLRKRKSIGKDEFQNTLVKAISSLSIYYVQNKNSETNSNKNKTNSAPEEEIMPKITFMTLWYKCFVYGKVGLKLPQYRLRNIIPKSQWVIKQAWNKFNQEKQDNNSDLSTLSLHASTKKDENSTQSKKKIGWVNTHILMIHCQEMKHKVILDSGSSTSVFCKEKYCNEIEQTTLIEIKTNGGSFYKVKKCSVTYDSIQLSLFFVHTEKGIIKFGENED